MDETEAAPAPPDSPVVWSADGAPRSARFDDVYFSADDGLAEARAVFLAGCDLPRAWAGRSRFVVGELGFGSGLNLIALLDLWRRTRPTGGVLQVFSIEAFPMSAADAARALSAWPEVADLSERLVSRWPRRARGFHRVDWPDLGASLDLAVMDVAEALESWSGLADAWFLDGFSPARNPAMWTPAVLKSVAERCAPGARAASFTVAGAVRRGLAAAGFEVARAPGFGRKRERLEARLPPAAAPAPRRLSIAIIGAGIAGAALARAFAALGAAVEVIDAAAPGAGASGNPAALVMPRLDAGGGAVAQLYAQAVARAADLYGQGGEAVIARGALQLETGPKDASRFDRIAASDLFPRGAVRRLTPSAMSAALGEASAVGGLALDEALVVSPDAVLSAWLQAASPHRARVARLEPAGEAWRLLDEDGGVIAVADAVCLAAGLASRDLAPGLRLAAVRGQASFVGAAERPAAAIGAGYLVPTHEGLLFGATHDRDDVALDPRAGDQARNLAMLRAFRPGLAASLDPTRIQDRAGVRAVTPDFLPLAGAMSQPGLYVLSGLGSRGFCAAPLLAEHVAALVLGAPSPLPRPLAEIVDPQRFEARRRRRLERARGSAAAAR